MQITTILVNDIPTVVVRPIDRKDLMRFLRNGRMFLEKGYENSALISHREATDCEKSSWEKARELHMTWGGDEDQFFGIPIETSPPKTIMELSK